ncbi:helix-turn-helix transcriptional regulator [Halococcus saccharolyticus]|uniref:helix-turn-helix transcriptional regulator n=1 Tax=Halococcus saccharolyticus TaxID=62319 RepID=UPI001266FC68|nr:hypothetical protein [Halococcus saccharolyticus]
MIEDAFQSENSILVHALPGTGKTTATFDVAAQLGLPITYLTERTDLYEQAEKLAQGRNLTAKILPSPHRNCPTFKGDHGGRWKSYIRDLYKRGVGGGSLHYQLNLPCNPNCPYRDQVDFDESQYDVIIGHYSHAHRESIIDDRIVVIDEFAEDALTRSFSEPEPIVSDFLNRFTKPPFSDWTDLVANRNNRRQISWFLANYDEMTLSPREIINNSGTTIHTSAGDLLLAMLFMEDLGNGFETTNAYIDSYEAGGRFYEGVSLSHLEPERQLLGNLVGVRNRTTNEMHLLNPPNLGAARSIVGLDGTPTLKMWNTVFRESFTHRQVIPENEQDHYLKDIQGYRIEQTKFNKPAAKHYSSGNQVTLEKDEGLFLGLELHYGKKPALMSTKKALDQYKQNGVLNRVEDSMNYGMMLSSNKFENKELGVVSGAPHPGDDVIKRWAALMGVAAEPNRNKSSGRGFGMDLSYGILGDEVFRHFREHQVLQAIFRFGRKGNLQPTVVLNTSAYPDWISVDETLNPKKFRGKKKREIVDYLREIGGGATQKEITTNTSASRKSVSECLKQLSDDGFVSRAGTNDSGVTLYEWV